MAIAVARPITFKAKLESQYELVILDCLLFFLRFYLFILRERGREGEREGEKHRWRNIDWLPPAHTPTWEGVGGGTGPATQACRHVP